VSQIDQADLLLAQVDGAEVRVNIGDTVTGAGWGSGVAVWGVDGLLSVPNAATGSGAAQGLYLTQGNQRRVIASRDTRWAGPFGALAAGDRALVSDCDAGLMLDKSANTIRLASAGGAAVTTGPASTVLTFGGCTVTLAALALTLEWAPSAGAPVASSITLNAAGVAITGLAVTVNGIPVP
jgi:hypothetical protein